MNVELFKSKLAGNVAAKAGITPKQAKEIVHCVLELPPRRIKRTFNFFGLGEVSLINRKAPAGVASTFVGATKIPYEVVVQFSVDNKLKELTFYDLARARRLARGRTDWGGFEKIITLGGLEGTPRVPVRRSNEPKETVKTGPQIQPAAPLPPKITKP